MPGSEPLKRLGGGRWETHDGRFNIEPQGGTWVVVDTTQTDELGLPLVRGPFPSLTAAKEHIEAARDEGPAESPLAERLSQPASPSKGKARMSSTPTSHEATPPRKTEAKPPAEPAWLRDLPPARRSAAHELIARLGKAGVPDPEAVARDEISRHVPAVARIAIERALTRGLEGERDPTVAARLVAEVMTAGADAALGVSWKLVDEAGRPIAQPELTPDD